MIYIPPCDSLSATTIGMWEQYDAALAVGDTAAAKSINQSVTPTNIVDYNAKLVNEIYLNTWARGIDSMSVSDSSLLASIALQHSHYGGSGVAQARALLGWLIKEPQVEASQYRFWF